ncbi:Sodium/hydrogen exchanger family-domain-containing protein [Pilobolus umbonatus]|nr:Sodium/hydrogen exchanger family-domain-containing protein [Pilobolus umbonatus]
MGRIPGFRETIFPPQSLPFINLIATLGLIFFLFQVGLEVNVSVIKQDWNKSVMIALAGMALPFGLGAAVSVGLYKLQNDDTIPYGSFLLFLGVAMSITAFPVLARILAELKLLRTNVGSITMASGLINDCTAWVLLALVVALLNSQGGLEALYVFLTAVGFSLFVIFVVGPLYHRLCIKTNSFEEGPSPLLMTITLLIVLVCAFITDIIGIHAIFGGFLAGVIIPHENDLTIKITEKIEDMVNIIFLPLYFTLSGLKTQIGLLDSGIVWGYVILVILVACVGKIVGCSAMAKLCGMTTRESLTIGFLMNCKGLVELIVLNIGHDAGVLNDQVFVIMVVMALVTTFMTSPVVIVLYPEWYQRQRMEINGGSVNQVSHTEDGKGMSRYSQLDRYTIVTMINRIECIPSTITLLQLLKQGKDNKSIELFALRLFELTQRPSAVMKLKDFNETQRHDPILNVIRTFANLTGINNIHTHIDFCSIQDYIRTVSDYGFNNDADLILLPWISPHDMATDNPMPASIVAPHVSPTPSDSDASNAFYLNDLFAYQVFSICQSSVAVFIDRGFGDGQEGDMNSDRFIMVVYRGGKDDRAAVLFALRLQTYHDLNVVVIRQAETEGVSNLNYASRENIHDYIMGGIEEQNDLNNLFKTNKTTRVVCRHVNEINEATIIESFPHKPRKHDLIIIGRRCISETSMEEGSDGQGKAVGILGFNLLQNTKAGNTSMIIVQSGEKRSGAEYS